MESIDALVVSMLSLCFYSESGVGRFRLAGEKERERWIISRGMSRITCANSVIFTIEKGGL